MRRYRPAGGEVIKNVGHDRMGVSVATDPTRALPEFGHVVPPIAVLLFDAQRPPLVAAAHPDVVASVKLHGNRTQAIDCIGLIGQAGPPRLSTNIILSASIR